MSKQIKQTKGNTYTIEKITDIFQIPQDSFADFLVDFEAYYEVGRSMTDLIYGAAKVRGDTVEVLPQKMVWTDDKRHDVKVILKPTGEQSNETN